MPDLEILDSTINLLKRRDGSKPWITATTISKKLNEEISSECVEKILLKHMEEKKEETEVRYSTLPHKETLEVLWGHTSHQKVGPREVNPLYRNDDVLKLFCINNPAEIDDEDARGFDIEFMKNGSKVFFSHSFKDFKIVKSIAQYLVQNEILPWLAETHIPKGEHINEAVISALTKSQHFLVYLSKNALNSRWTGKELGRAISQEINVSIIIDCNNSNLKEMVQYRYHGRKYSRYASDRASDLFESVIREKNPLIKWVVYPEKKWKELGFDKPKNEIYPYGDLPRLVKEASQNEENID